MSEVQTLLEVFQKALADYSGEGKKANPHGPSGLMASGYRPDAPNAIVKPDNLAASLPLVPANSDNDNKEIFTMVTAPTGSVPATTCATPDQAGQLQKTKVQTPFGQFFLGTQTIKTDDQNLRRDLADTDRYLINNWISADMSQNPYVPMPETGLNLNHIIGKRYVEFGVNAANQFSICMFQGVNGTPGAGSMVGWVEQFNGMETLVSTATYSAAGAQPIVVTGGTLNATAVGRIINAFRSVKMRAMQSGMPGVEWEIWAHPSIMYDLFDVWACNFATAKCSNSAGEFDLMYARDLRIAMKDGMYLMIDGQNVPVRFDAGVADSIGTSPNAGQYTTDLFIIPRRWAGQDLIYYEYLPYFGNNIGSTESYTGFGQVPFNNGFYLRNVEKNHYCVTHEFSHRGRIVLDFPFLAARVDNLVYTPAWTYRDPTTFDGGGITAEAS